MSNQTPVKIQRIGNLLQVTPACKEILHPVLSYSHRSMNTNWRSTKAGKMKFERKLLYQIKGTTLRTTQGAFHAVTTQLTRMQLAWEFEDARPVNKIEPDLEHLARCMPKLQFRLKQDEIMAHIIAHNSGIIVAPTAYGKTFIMLALVAMYPTANIIMASPGVSLLDSVYRRMLGVVGSEVGRVGGGHKNPQRVTLSTLHSLLNAPVEKCDILLIDECHRAASRTFSTNIAYVRNAIKIFGMTATPTGRHDGSELVAEVLIGPTIYTVGYKEAAEAGLVSKIKVARLSLPPSESCKPVSTMYVKSVSRVRHGFWQNTARNKLFANAMTHIPRKYGIPDDAQRLILVKTLEHALRLKKLLPSYELVYRTMKKASKEQWIAGGLLPKGYTPLTDSKRRHMLRDFEDGRLRRVIATSCWGEGVDFVHLEVVANASGEGSHITTTQWTGRASRIGDGSKTLGLLIDCSDTWDPWAQRRAASRKRTYREHGWEIVEVDLDNEIQNKDRAAKG